MGYGSCLLLIAGLFDQRHNLRSALSVEATATAGRLFAIYVLLLGLIAVIVNAVLIGIWLVERVR